MDVTSTSSTTTQTTDLTSLAGSSSTMGKEEFLQLLVTQLQNQDPLNPTENTEFVAQLSQFSSLEQLLNVNTALEGQADIFQSLHNTMMTNLIGREVMVSNDTLYWDGSEASLSYVVPSTTEVSIQVFDEDGNMVATQSLGTVASGEQTFTWDGKDQFGNDLDYGSYQFQFLIDDGEGGTSTLETYQTGKVTSLEYVNGGAILYLGQQAVYPSEIVAIRE
jgi:flagellar basal-body rod modification protein FlgD